MLDRNSPTPLHAQLSDLLRAAIVSGEHLPWTKLPSESDLCRAYGVSRTTVRQALGILANKGLIHTSAGKGTFVSSRSLDGELRPLIGFSEEAERRGQRSVSRVLNSAVVLADDLQAARLRVAPGAEVAQLHRLRLVGDLPIVVQVAILPYHLCPGLLDHDFGRISLYDTLRSDYHLNLTAADTRIRAAVASQDECQLLQLAPPAAVLVSEQTSYVDDGTVVEFTQSTFAGERYALYTRIP